MQTPSTSKYKSAKILLFKIIDVYLYARVRVCVCMLVCLWEYVCMYVCVLVCQCVFVDLDVFYDLLDLLCHAE